MPQVLPVVVCPHQHPTKLLPLKFYHCTEHGKGSICICINFLKLGCVCFCVCLYENYMHVFIQLRFGLQENTKTEERLDSFLGRCFFFFFWKKGRVFDLMIVLTMCPYLLYCSYPSMEKNVRKRKGMEQTEIKR